MKGSVANSLTRWLGETPLGSDSSAPRHGRFPFGGFVRIFRGRAMSAEVAHFSRSSSETTLPFSPTSSSDSESWQLLLLHGSAEPLWEQEGPLLLDIELVAIFYSHVTPFMLRNLPIIPALLTMPRETDYSEYYAGILGASLRGNYALRNNKPIYS